MPAGSVRQWHGLDVVFELLCGVRVCDCRVNNANRVDEHVSPRPVQRSRLGRVQLLRGWLLRHGVGHDQRYVYRAMCRGVLLQRRCHVSDAGTVRGRAVQCWCRGRVQPVSGGQVWLHEWAASG